jgi:hypothetical protein
MRVPFTESGCASWMTKTRWLKWYGCCCSGGAAWGQWWCEFGTDEVPCLLQIQEQEEFLMEQRHWITCDHKSISKCICCLSLLTRTSIGCWVVAPVWGLLLSYFIIVFKCLSVDILDSWCMTTCVSMYVMFHVKKYGGLLIPMWCTVNNKYFFATKNACHVTKISNISFHESGISS